MTLRIKTTIAATLLPISTLAVVLLGILPLARNVTALADDVTNTRIEQTSLEKQLEDISAVVRQYKKIQSDASRLSTAFVNGNDALSFIETLESVASASGMTQDITLDAPKAPANPTTAPITVPVTLRAEGTFASTLAYIQALERLPIYLLFTDLSLVRGSTLVGSTLPGTGLDLTINATTFWVFSP